MKAYAVVDSEGCTYTINTPRGFMLVMSPDYKEMATYVSKATEEGLRSVPVEITLA